MPTRREATVEDLYKVPEHGKAELVNGELVLMSIFAVEVRSEDDYGPAAERAMASKRADYFSASRRI